MPQEHAEQLAFELSELIDAEKGFINSVKILCDSLKEMPHNSMPLWEACNAISSELTHMQQHATEAHRIMDALHKVAQEYPPINAMTDIEKSEYVIGQARDKIEKMTGGRFGAKKQVDDGPSGKDQE